MCEAWVQLAIVVCLVDPSVITRWLLGALLINPDVTTFWNMRRELLRAGRLDIRAELHLTAVILSRKPKSGEAFSYRKSLVRRFVLQQGIDKDLILDQELAISQDSASRYSTNYHAWSHRTWCLKEICPQTSTPFKTILNEWAVSEEWIKSHVSDHSGMQYRQFLQDQLCQVIIPPTSINLTSTMQGRDLVDKSLASLTHYISLDKAMYEPTCSKNVLSHSEQEFSQSRKDTVSPLVNILGIIASELLLNVDLILRFSGHEALWCHRKFLMSSLTKTLALQSCDFSLVENGPPKGAVGARKPVCENTCRFSKDQKLKEGDCRPSSTGNNRHYSHMNTDGIPLEKDQKLSSVFDLDVDQICSLFSEALQWHECQLMSKCVGEDYQQTLATKYRNWLCHILRIDLREHNISKPSTCT